MQDSMQLAAVDIGSNAIRLQIVRPIMEGNLVSFKKTEYIRFPLRLGDDVFKKGKISKNTADRFLKLMTAFKLLIDLYDVKDHIAVATSAMREASNGMEIVAQVEEVSGLKIQIIEGGLEAEILSKAIIPVISNGYFIHIDVGGGSTELNLYNEKVRIASKSFNIGSVRKLSPEQKQKTFDEIKDWYAQAEVPAKTTVNAIGTGGNINKIYSLANIKGNNMMSIHEMEAIKAYISTYTLDQRVSILMMNPDRADVVIPASEIYIKVMKIIGATQMYVPGVGLKDGLVYNLYEKASQTSLSNVRFLDQLYMEY
ncbi:MAG TPA: phosphatase [Saprospiraceae bacterium]|nr:phosphatase [Saprospiraceae bacterium]HPN70167.1 phosphatase [Saprospiraceae bacterium]